MPVESRTGSGGNRRVRRDARSFPQTLPTLEASASPAATSMLTKLGDKRTSGFNAKHQSAFDNAHRLILPAAKPTFSLL